MPGGEDWLSKFRERKQKFSSGTGHVTGEDGPSSMATPVRARKPRPGNGVYAQAQVPDDNAVETRPNPATARFSVFAFLGRVVNSLEAAFGNTAGSQVLLGIGLISCLWVIVFAIVYSTHHAVTTGFMDTMEATKHMAIRVGAAATAVGSGVFGAGMAATSIVGSSVASASAVLISQGNTFVCGHSALASVASRLGVPCEESPEDPLGQVYEAMEGGTSTVAYWGRVAEEILPHGNYFRMASGMLIDLVVIVKHSPVDVPDANLIVETFDAYRDSLHNAGRQVYCVILRTSSLVAAMVDNLYHAEHDLKALQYDRSWFTAHTKRRQELVNKVGEFVDIHLIMIEELIVQVGRCAWSVEKADHHGTSLNMHTTKARAALQELQKEHVQRGSRFLGTRSGESNPQIERLRTALKPPVFATSDINAKLREVKHRLDKHYDQLTQIKVNFKDRPETSVNLDAVLNVLQRSCESLADTESALRRAQDEEDARFQQQIDRGYFLAP